MMKKHLYQAPAVNKKRYGDTVVTMLSDGYLDASFELLNGIEASQAEAALEQKGGRASSKNEYQCLCCRDIKSNHTD
ncbi:TPA: hypothetical protein O4G69_002782 [Vibrio alginolyticus]|nr:hypothetical protein [Vibrio alginolyticus]